MLYLDHAATTPVRPEVVSAMLPYLTREFGNPSSHHTVGEAAASVLVDARRRVAAVLGMRPGDVVFTSGGTEANNLAVKGVAVADLLRRGRPGSIVTTPIEHESILASCDHLARLHGVDVVRVKLGIFVLAGAMASVGGMLLALFVSGAYPEFGFWTTSGEAIFMIMLGGSQLFIGPVIGAVLLRLIEHFVTIYTEHHGLVLGVVILVIVLGLRQGVADFIVDWLDRRREAKAASAEKGAA